MSSSPSAGNSPQVTGKPDGAPAPHRSKWWLWLILVAVVGYAGWKMFGRSAANSQAQNQAAGRGRMFVGEVPILAATAREGDIGVYVAGLGTVTPVYTVTVTSRVQGQIMEVHYREGQMVHKGDPLLEIDPRPYQAALTQAEGQLAHDQAVLKEARIDSDRYQAAFARNAIAQQQVADQEQVVHQDEGTVKIDEGMVENARINLIYCHITSPIDGRVGLRLVDPGNIVQANSATALVVVTQLQPITVIFSIAEDYLGSIQAQLLHGKTLSVDVFDRSLQTKLATGTLLTVDNQIDPTTGTVKLRAIFSNAGSTLFPNQFVNARLLVDMLHGVTLVPSSAVQRNAQGAYLYTISPDMKASISPIKEGTTDGAVTQVEGVKAGEMVATDGFDKLQDGAKVHIRSGSGKAQAAAPEAKSPAKEASSQ
ncbi:MAG TPA: efflux RND transporter periplasmic adaptor subunit [Candidatus Acidoferrales bacterium]|nr:efflux RND transporter periplasmic adaptor subunit [Candidatus Acidoferrales bacterium]